MKTPLIMKKALLLSLGIALLCLTSCATRNEILKKGNIDYGKRYAQIIDKRATIIKAEYSFVSAKLSNGNYVFYTIFPEKNVVTSRTEYKDQKMSIPTGVYRGYYWDSGKLQIEGEFDRKGNKTGFWKAYYTDGKVEKLVHYANDLRNGQDISFSPQANDTVLITTFKNGVLDGEAKYFDKNGKLYALGKFKNNEVVKEQKVQEQLGIDIEARFKHITCNKKDSIKQYKCSQKALKDYMKFNIGYPVIDLELGVQGLVIVGFTVETDGSISNINIKRGLSSLMNESAINLISQMPKWNPAYINGVPTKQDIVFPIIYKSKLTLDNFRPVKPIFFNDNIFCICQ